MVRIRVRRVLLVWTLLLAAGSDSRAGQAGPPSPAVQPVATLFDHLAQINGDDASTLPVLCFDVDDASLPNPSKSRDREKRAELKARRDSMLAAVSLLAHDLVSAYRASGSSASPIAIRVIGHADSIFPEGDKDYNGQLSYRRALTIANLLRADVARFGGALRLRLATEVEGHSSFEPFEPWPENTIDRPNHCSSLPPKSLAAAAEGGPKPVPADRRVEIEILSGALTSSGPEKVGSETDRRLRVYPFGTMPWRPVTVSLLEPPEHGVEKIDDECFDGTKPPPGTSWIPLSKERSLIDYGEGGMAVRFLATPVYAPVRKGLAPVLKGLRVEFRLARGSDEKNHGLGIPGYWSVHERLPSFFKNIPDDPPGTLLRLAKCVAPKGKAADAGYFSQDPLPADTTKSALDRLPKDIDGIMAAVYGLNRNLRFIDLKPGMKVQFKGSLGEPFGQRLQPAGTGLLQLISDPINPCASDPTPRPVATPFQSKIADPFLAWMSHSAFWSSCGGAAQAAAAPGAEAAAVAPNVNETSEHFLISGFSQLELLLSWGPTRFFLPREEHPKPQAASVAPQQAGSWGSFLVASPDIALIDELTLEAAEDASLKPTQFNIYNKCINLGSGNLTHCGFLFAQETFSPLASFGVNGKTIEQLIGTRVVHLAPAKIYDRCFPVNSMGKWPDEALLTQPITWKSPILREGALIDRRDCRLLALPMVDGSIVSW